jgi:hypothetical protein
VKRARICSFGPNCCSRPLPDNRARATYCIAAEQIGRCPLWVKSRHRSTPDRCPLYPRKRTLHCTAANVRFVPIADIGRLSCYVRSVSLTEVVGANLRKIRRGSSVARNWRNCLNVAAGPLQFRQYHHKHHNGIGRFGCIPYSWRLGCRQSTVCRCRRNECSRSSFGHDI